MVFPHMSEIARKYRDKGLKVVGISVEEYSNSLEQFVQQQGPKMDYTVRPPRCLPPSRSLLRALHKSMLVAANVGMQVAVDPRGTAGQQLMAAAQVSGIPHAFVVDGSGVVQYSGHPMDPTFEAAVQRVRGLWACEYDAKAVTPGNQLNGGPCMACPRWWRSRRSSRGSSGSCRLSRKAARSSWHCL